MKTFFDAVVSIPAPFNMVVMIVVVVFGCWMFCEFVKQLRIFACHRQELALKRELAEHGMNGSEIEQIISATSPYAMRDAEAEAEATVAVHSVQAAQA
ncbi:hypothetical protein [Adhaeretor mobilis]|uniref:Uncharacterized protein n=1 Tax=Adhaeretor mobilis TaxID=1930276 RepID=A0A517N3B8_9BACT|nr:hypothetical protein [Adhaeretor mobilis]QDT01624.1 hypothetical protein HG15A2_49710 [Adhaeretor mobilis]